MLADEEDRKQRHQTEIEIKAAQRIYEDAIERENVIECQSVDMHSLDGTRREDNSLDNGSSHLEILRSFR